MEQLSQSHPDITAVYAENDEMALGAMNALKARGQEPRQGRQDRLDRRHPQRRAGHRGRHYNAVIESNPRFGPLAFETAEEVLRRRGRSRRT